MAGPLASLILFLTNLGALLGLVLLALYLAALPLGWLAGAYGGAELALGRRRESASRAVRALALAAAIAVLALLQFIPVAGQLLALAVLLFGLGGLVRTGWRAYRAPQGAV